MTKVLVTGASGFVGKNLIPKLHSLRYEVIETNSKSEDVTKSATWDAFPDVDVVIHLAARTFVPDSWNDPAGFFSSNFNGTIYALEYCRQRKARMIFASAYLYGNPDRLPISESSPLYSNNPYALSKKLAEEACRFYAQHYNVNVTVLRPFNIYGFGQDSKWLIPEIINQTICNTEIQVKDLEPRRDYVYIKDVVDAFVKSIENPQKFGIFNIGSGVSFSVIEVIDKIQNIVGTCLPVVSLNQRREQEIMDTVADISQAKNILAWSPVWTLEKGIKEIIQLTRENRKLK